MKILLILLNPDDFTLRVCNLFTYFWIRQYLLFSNLIQFHAYGRIIYTLTFLVLVIILTSSYSALGIAFSLSTAMTVQKIFEFTIYRKKIK